MISGKELKNRWLVSLDEGIKVGEVKELYLSSEAEQLAGVITSSSGLLKRTSWMVLREDIGLFGKDVWLVNSTNVPVELGKSDKEEQMLPLNDLRGRQINSTEGMPVGMILDVVLDGQMMVAAFRIGRVNKESPLAKQKSISRGSVVSLGSSKEPMVIDLNKALLPDD